MVTALIPAYRAGESIAATVIALRRLPQVGSVIVVDDGSPDDTAAQAQYAGARVLRHPHNRGKGAALRTAAATLGEGTEVVLLLDADLGATAAEAGKLLAPVLAGQAHLAIATLPAAGKGAGFGLAVRSARLLIWLLTGRVMQAPLSGQRALTAALLRRVRFADRFAVEVALTLDALLLGAQVVEVPTEFQHQVTGWSLPHLRHRARQLLDVWRAALPRLCYPFDAAGRPAPGRRGLISAAAVGLLCAGLGSLPGDWPAALASWTVLGLCCLVAAWWLCRVGNLQRENYRGERIPGALGLGAVLFAVVAGRLGLLGYAQLPVIVGGGFGFLGLLDDRWGSSQARGLRGHLGELRRGQVTTGLLKLVGGVALGLLVGLLLSGPGPLAVVDGLLIALCANFLNLLDLRPGRALKGWLLLALPAFAAAAACRPLLAGLAVALALYAPLDLGAKGMLGDTGANASGALAGLALALAAPLWAKLVLVLLLVGVHLLAEVRSLGALIEAQPELAWLDRLGRRDLG